MSRSIKTMKLQKYFIYLLLMTYPLQSCKKPSSGNSTETASHSNPSKGTDELVFVVRDDGLVAFTVWVNDEPVLRYPGGLMFVGLSRPPLKQGENKVNLIMDRFDQENRSIIDVNAVVKNLSKKAKIDWVQNNEGKSAKFTYSSPVVGWGEFAPGKIKDSDCEVVKSWLIRIVNSSEKMKPLNLSDFFESPRDINKKITWPMGEPGGRMIYRVGKADELDFSRGESMILVYPRPNRDQKLVNSIFSYEKNGVTFNMNCQSFVVDLNDNIYAVLGNGGIAKIRSP